jgi:hypothetical protein
MYYVALAVFAAALIWGAVSLASPDAPTALDARERVAAVKICKRFAVVNPERCVAEEMQTMREQEVVPR